MKTSDLIGPALDWAVATCEKNWAFEPDGCDSYSTDWALGGPIIEREGITVSKEQGCWSAYFRDNLFEDDGSEHWQTGLTPLVAAMRCFVSSRLGDDIEIPSELIKGI